MGFYAHTLVWCLSVRSLGRLPGWPFWRVYSVASGKEYMNIMAALVFFTLHMSIQLEFQPFGKYYSSSANQHNFKICKLGQHL